MNKLSIQDLKDAVVGATFLGSGGGGSPENGFQLVEEIAKHTADIELVSPNEVPDNAYVAMVAGMGSPVALKEKGFGPEGIHAFEGLERIYGWTGVSFNYIMPCETGGFNCITPIHVAAVKNLKVVDADGAGGRAVPELSTMLYYLNDIPTSPFVLADKEGNIVVGWTKDPMDAPLCEEIARHVVVAFGQEAGLATWVVTGHQIKTQLEPGVISTSVLLGRAIRTAREKGEDPVSAAVKASDGYELIRGTIKEIETKMMGGFDFGRTTIEGSDGYRGKKLFVDFKNENMIAWRSEDETVAMVPDKICQMTLDGAPLTNADTEEGMDLAVIGVKASDRWRKHPKGFSVWKPILEKMGYDKEFVPIENLID